MKIKWEVKADKGKANFMISIIQNFLNIVCTLYIGKGLN